MRRLQYLRSIGPVPNRSMRPGFRSHEISRAIRGAVLAIACCFALLTDTRAALAGPAADQEMANRYEQSAQAGDDDAQFYLGAFHSAGVGRPRNDEAAFHWFQRATDQGHPHAMLIVAGLYASGRGTAKDDAKAYKWGYIVNSASKVDEYRNGARQLMSLLEKRMNSDQIGHAVLAARAWRAVPVSGAVKPSNIERAADASSNQSEPAAPAAAPAPPAVQPAPVAAPAPANVQPAPSNITVLPAPPQTAPAPPAKSAKRDDLNDLIDQVPSGLRKRFGF
jgi:Sel1 repeat-containing protein